MFSVKFLSGPTAVNDAGFDVYLAYSAWSGSTFTLSGTYDFSGTDQNAGVANGNDLYITYILHCKIDVNEFGSTLSSIK